MSRAPTACGRRWRLICPFGRDILGWRRNCACQTDDVVPCLVLDPFAGSGRTAIVARRLQLDFVGCELNPEYVEMGKRLVKADAPLFNTVED